MGVNNIGSNVEPKRAKKMIDRIIKLEKNNIHTKHMTDRVMVEKIKTIIREEADAYAD